MVYKRFWTNWEWVYNIICWFLHLPELYGMLINKHLKNYQFESNQTLAFPDLSDRNFILHGAPFNFYGVFNESPFYFSVLNAI